MPTAPVLPLRTDRLHLTVMRPEHAAALVRYRNDPEVARFQDWDLPYTLGAAEEMLQGQAHLDDIEVGEWVQVAVEHGSQLVGDVAIGYLKGGTQAMIGYTLAPEWQGRGFATEAVTAVVDALLERTEVHRIVATLDPQNHASMRVIEPLGFRFEGIARGAELIRGEWLDDMRFGLLRSDRAAWLARPAGPPTTVELVELADDNLRDVSALATFTFQEQHVAPMARSLAQALVPPRHDGHRVLPWYRAVRADGEIVGFVMLSAVTEHEPIPYLWRFLIDRHHQRRGIGERVIAQLVELAKADGHTSMLVSWVDLPGGPRRFYERLGFVPVPDAPGKEVEARLHFAGR